MGPTAANVCRRVIVCSGTVGGCDPASERLKREEIKLAAADDSAKKLKLGSVSEV